MGRAKQSMAPAVAGSRRRTTKTRQTVTPVAVEQAPKTPVPASGFDPSLFAAPDIYAGDFASVETETDDERNTYYGGPDDYYNDDDYYSSGSGRDSSYQVITGVHLEAASPNDILLTVMRRLEDKPVVAELKRNPIFFYGAGRAAQRFSKKLGGAYVEYQSEGDYYGERLTSIELSPEYEGALKEFEAE